MQHRHREVGRHKARGDAARRQAPEDGEVSERVVERAGGPGEHHFTGAAAQRLVDRELAVGHILAHRVAHEFDSGGLQGRGAGFVERVEVADDRIRLHAEAVEEARAAVGGQQDVGAGDERRGTSRGRRTSPSRNTTASDAPHMLLGRGSSRAHPRTPGKATS